MLFTRLNADLVLATVLNLDPLAKVSEHTEASHHLSQAQFPKSFPRKTSADWGCLPTTKMDSGRVQSEASCLLLKGPPAVCGVGLAVSSPKVPQAV